MFSNERELSLDSNLCSPIACNNSVSYTSVSMLNCFSPCEFQSPQDGIAEFEEQGTLAITPEQRMIEVSLESMDQTYENVEVEVAHLQP